MTKKHEVEELFRNELSAFIESVISKKKAGKRIPYGAEAAKLYDILRESPEYEVNVSFEDVYYIAVLKVPKVVGDKEQLEKFWKGVETIVLGKPFLYKFYLRVGNIDSFSDGYQIGAGKLYPFTSLPSTVQNEIRLDWPINYKESSEGQSRRQYFASREKNWYIYYEVTAIGWWKALEKVQEAAKRSSGLFKLVYGEDNELVLQTSSYLDVYSSSDFYDVKAVGRYNISHRDRIRHNKEVDHVVTALNDIVVNGGKKDLEERILGVIDIYSMISADMPLHIRFMLNIISLESLLMPRSSEENLRYKIAERVSLLLGNEPWWVSIYKSHVRSDDEKPPSRKQWSSFYRMKLNKLVLDLYDKRSSFAHTGLRIRSKPKSKLTEKDLELASLIVALTVHILLHVREQGVTTINKVENEVTLDDYIEKLKFGGPRFSLEYQRLEEL